MSYRYATRTAWIDDLTPEHEPSDYDLCAQHADALTVPVGWAREDRRTIARLPFSRPIAV